MPYQIEKQGDEWCVVKEKGGKSMGCHPTEKEAQAQMRALYASEKKEVEDDFLSVPETTLKESATDADFLDLGGERTQGSDAKDASEKALKLSQPEAGYVAVSMTPGKACAGCRWFDSYGTQNGYDAGHPLCWLVTDYPLPIEPTGYCERYEVAPSLEYHPEPMPVVIVEAEAYEEDKAVEAVVAPEVDEAARKEMDDPCIAKHLKKMLAEGMDQAEAMKKAESMCAEEKPHKSLTAQVKDRLSNLLSRKEVLENGIKVDGNHFLITWSNDFEDRDGEIFTRKAIDDYVDRTDAGPTPMPLIWVWHTGERTRVGEAEWVARQEHFLIAAGEFDDTPAAQKAKAYYAKNAKKTSVSHGFTYPQDQFDGKHYHAFNTFEISLLPRGVEANRYTTLEGVKAMALTEQKKRYLEDVFGKETAEQILSDLTERGKALEELGATFKDFIVVNPDETPASKEAVEQVETGLKEMFVDVIGDNAEAFRLMTTMGKAFEQREAAAKEYAEAQDAKIAALTAEVNGFKERLGDAPRIASRAAETEISKDDPRFKAIEDAVRQQTKTRDPFTGLEVNSLDEEG